MWSWSVLVSLIVKNYCEEEVTTVKYKHMEEEPDDSKPSKRLTSP